MNVRLAAGFFFLSVPLLAQEAATDLPEVVVYSPRVALQDPVATFAMPVTALRYEPLVDVQGRNVAEGQADIAIRGGTFENTGFRVGAVSLYDPLTGHYADEIPIAPAMLSAPSILTGAENAEWGWNADAGTVAYQWKRIRTGGYASATVGDYATRGGEFYDGYASNQTIAGRHLSVDASASYSQSDGTRPFGESDFRRFNVRLQLADTSSQTDVFLGYQSKQFGWPDLYTPFPNIFETDDLRTTLLLVNHRVDFGGGDYVSAGAYFRRNLDHYVFNRTDPGAFFAPFPTLPAFHADWVYSAGVEGRLTLREIHWNYSATLESDNLHSTTLVYGKFNSRTQEKLMVAPEKDWTLDGGRVLSAKAGLTYDDSNRDSGTLSPLAEIAVDHLSTIGGVNKIYISYARTSETPTYFALNSAPSSGLFFGNANLKRETSNNIEIGTTVGEGTWTTTAAIFYRRDTNLVDWTYAFDETNARAANSVNIDNAGIELTTRYSVKAFDLTLGYTALHKTADYGASDVDASFYALNYPEQRVTLALVARLGHGWELRMDNEYREEKPDALRTSTSHPFISSAGVYYMIPSIRGLRLSFEVDNLWNTNYQTVPAVPSTKRQFAFGATYAW